MDGERFHRRLTDVGLYSLGGLCAVSLADLFYEECHVDFKKKTMEKILLDLGQPKQTNASLMAMLDGEMLKDSTVFVRSIFDEECTKVSRQPIVADLIALAICEGCYDARMRVLIKHVAWQLKISWDIVEETEAVMAETLEYSTYTASEEEAKEKAKKTRNSKIKRYAMIGLATVGGGAIIGLTGGLAAPLVAVGAGAVIGGAGAAALGSAAGVAIIGSLFGVAGAGLTGYKMKRRVGAVEEFTFEPLTLIGSRLDPQKTVKQLHITIAVTGWLNDKCQDFRIPWRDLAESREQYSLRWESKYLYQLGEAFDYLLQTGISMATTEALKYTILSGLITAIAWPAALLSASNVIDNPWHVCTHRASQAGKQLAEVLLGREQGNRPVTLIGFSLGSRVIFSCLEELAKRKGGEGLVEDVILLGAPVSGESKHWKPFTKVVAGKIVNGYSRGDWLLKFLFRTASVTFKVAGLGPIEWTDRRMHNIDLSDVIDGHGDYMKYPDTIMKAVGIRTKDELKPFDNIVKIGESVSDNKTSNSPEKPSSENTTTENTTTENTTSENTTTENTTTENATTDNTTTVNGTTVNGTTENTTSENSATENTTTENGATENTTTENTTSENTTSVNGTTENTTIENTTIENSTTENSLMVNSPTVNSSNENSTTDNIPAVVSDVPVDKTETVCTDVNVAVTTQPDSENSSDENQQEMKLADNTPLPTGIVGSIQTGIEPSSDNGHDDIGEESTNEEDKLGIDKDSIVENATGKDNVNYKKGTKTD